MTLTLTISKLTNQMSGMGGLIAMKQTNKQKKTNSLIEPIGSDVSQLWLIVNGVTWDVDSSIFFFMQSQWSLGVIHAVMIFLSHGGIIW